MVDYLGRVLDHDLGIYKSKDRGVFVILSTRRIKSDELLSHYYVRQDIEQVFDISKNYASLLPLNVEKKKHSEGIC